MGLTAAEQFMIELVNRGRLDPLAEAARFGIDLNQGLSPGRLDGTARQVVAPNALLEAAAASHAQWMLAANTFSHTGSGGSSPTERMRDAGYVFSGNWASGENIAWRGTTGTIDLDDAIMAQYRGLFLSSGHRTNLLDGYFTEIGIAQERGMFSSNGSNYDTSMVVQKFARSGTEAFVTGVAYQDTDGDAFYSIGEGQSGIAVSVAAASATTAAAGGYAISITPGSSVAIDIGGIGMVADLSAGNAKIDLVDGTRVETSVDTTLTSAAGSLTALGVADIALTGHSGGDTLVGNTGNNQLSGGLGGDRLVGGGGNDLLFGEKLEIGLVFEESAQIFRLYGATLGRAPDTAGHLNWVISLLEGRQTLESAADGFVNSSEFRARYDATTNEQFVTLLYQNVLGRAPDPSGLAGWVDRLESGAMTRAQVVLGLADSTENQNRTMASARDFIESHSDAVWSDDVFRFYQATLARTPDEAGFTHWAQQLGDGRSTLDVVSGFVNSTEFQTRYGAAATSTDFVTLIYQNVLGRAPDSAGLAAWTDRLDNQGWTRAQVVLGVAQSPEFIGSSSAGLLSWMRGLGIDDTLVGGTGANVLAGGLFSDDFVFETSAAGNHRVTDLEAWDHLTFDGFGYATAADARAHMIQTGSDVTFADQGVSVVFENTSLSQLADDAMFGLV